MEKHFKISGGEPVCTLDNDVKVLRRLGLMIFKSDTFEKTIPVKWNNITPKCIGHLIIYIDASGTFMFNCKDQSIAKLCSGRVNVLRHYLHNGDIYLQFVDALIRISDNASISLPFKTDYIIKGNDEYTVIAYIKGDKVDDVPIWGIMVDDDPEMETKKPPYRPILKYTIYKTSNLEKIGSDNISISQPSYFRYFTVALLHKYIDVIANKIEVTDTYIRIYDMHYEYIKPVTNDSGEECCVCFEKRDMKQLQCSHSVCVMCEPKVEKCPLCRAHKSETINTPVTLDKEGE